MAERISWKRFYRCGGGESFMFNVSATHHRRTWQVDQVQSPESIFLKDWTSFWFDKSFVSRYRKTCTVRGIRYVGRGAAYGINPGIVP